MSTKISIAADELPEVLRQYVNKNGFLEIVTRRADGTCEPFINAVISSSETQSKESLKQKIIEASLNGFNSADRGNLHNIQGLVKKAIHNSDRNYAKLYALAQDQIQVINQVSTGIGSLQDMVGMVQGVAWLNTAVSLVNLGTSVAGFAELNKRLNEISKQISTMSEQLNKLVDFHKQYFVLKDYKSIVFDGQKFLQKLSEGKIVELSKIEDWLKAVKLFLEDVPNIGLLEIEDICTIFYQILPIYTDLIIWLLEMYPDQINEGDNDVINYKRCLGFVSSKDFYNMVMDEYQLKSVYTNKQTADILNQMFLVNTNLMLKFQDTVDLLKIAKTPEEYQTMKEAINEMAFNKTKDILKTLNNELSAETAENLYRIAIIEGFGEKWRERAEQNINVMKIQTAC